MSSNPQKNPTQSQNNFNVQQQDSSIPGNKFEKPLSDDEYEYENDVDLQDYQSQQFDEYKNQRIGGEDNRVKKGKRIKSQDNRVLRIIISIICIFLIVSFMYVVSVNLSVKRDNHQMNTNTKNKNRIIKQKVKEKQQNDIQEQQKQPQVDKPTTPPSSSPYCGSNLLRTPKKLPQNMNTNFRQIYLQTNYNFNLYVDTKDQQLYQQLLRKGIWKQEYISLMGFLVRPGDSVLCAGTRSGIEVVAMGKIIGEQGEIFVMEADGFIRDIVKKNVLNNGLDHITTIYDKGASEKYKKFSSLYEDQLTYNTVDSTLPQKKRIDFAYIHNNMEIETLKGMRGLISRSPGLIIMLSWRLPSEEKGKKTEALAIMQYLMQKGYKIYKYQSGNVAQCKIGKFIKFSSYFQILNQIQVQLILIPSSHSYASKLIQEKQRSFKQFLLDSMKTGSTSSQKNYPQYSPPVQTPITPTPTPTTTPITPTPTPTTTPVPAVQPAQPPKIPQPSKYFLLSQMKQSFPRLQSSQFNIQKKDQNIDKIFNITINQTYFDNINLQFDYKSHGIYNNIQVGSNFDYFGLGKKINMEEVGQIMKDNIAYQVLEFKKDQNLEKGKQLLEFDLQKQSATYRMIAQLSLAISLAKSPYNIQTLKQQYIQLDKKYNISQPTTQSPICIYSSGYKLFSKNRYKLFFESVQRQNYTNYHIVYVDDNSPDQSAYNIYDYLNSTNTRLTNRIKIIHNFQHLGALANMFFWIKKYCGDDDIVIVLDGDDSLIGNQVFQVLNNVYKNQKYWYVYSNYANSFPNGRITKGIASGPFNSNTENYRATPLIWMTSHIKTFRKKLMDAMPIEHFIQFHYDQASKIAYPHFYDSSYDRFQVYAQLEMAGNDRIFHITDYLYLYDEQIGVSANPCYRQHERYDEYKARLKTPLQRLQSLDQKPKYRENYNVSQRILSMLMQKYGKYQKCGAKPTY